ncbi:Fc.00g004910.m01.CDS01 [Cosmosporella sp. VM-42]
MANNGQHALSPGLQHARRTSSHSSVDLMPVISETEVARSVPEMPLRIPPKSSRRFSAANPLARGLPPPYVPTLHHSPGPPSYKEAQWKLEERATQLKIVDGTKRRLCGWDRRQCCCVLLVAAGVLSILAVGLAVGLSVGLKKSNHSNSDAEAEGSEPTFPAGSYTFNTTLETTNTSCTSNPSTWRCYPYSTGQPASFFWIIDEVNASSYSISSTDNPFAPSFTNLTLTLHDADTSAERLTFSFDMDKVVVPSQAITPDNKATKCTFEDTSFEATIWTKKGGDGQDRKVSQKFGDWPGDVEVVQKKNAGEGGQKCVDSSGNEITDVQAKDGECECRYASVEDM